MSIKRAYLFAYNGAQFLGWAAALARLLPLISPLSLDSAYLEGGKVVGEGKDWITCYGVPVAWITACPNTLVLGAKLTL